MRDLPQSFRLAQMNEEGPEDRGVGREIGEINERGHHKQPLSWAGLREALGAVESIKFLLQEVVEH